MGSPVCFQTTFHDLILDIYKSALYTLEHAYRESNFCANWLATKDLDYPLGLTLFNSSPNGLSSFIFDDLCSVYRSKLLV